MGERLRLGQRGKVSSVPGGEYGIVTNIETDVELYTYSCTYVGVTPLSHARTHTDGGCFPHNVGRESKLPPLAARAAALLAHYFSAGADLTDVPGPRHGARAHGPHVCVRES